MSPRHIEQSTTIVGPRVSGFSKFDFCPGGGVRKGTSAPEEYEEDMLERAECLIA